MRELWPKGLSRYLARHPRDIGTVLASAWVLRRNGWWRSRPFLPVPDSQYWQFRRSTANGNNPRELTGEEIVAAARWSRHERRRR